jgi:hypothetical protein
MDKQKFTRNKPLSTIIGRNDINDGTKPHGKLDPLPNPKIISLPKNITDGLVVYPNIAPEEIVEEEFQPIKEDRLELLN